MEMLSNASNGEKEKNNGGDTSSISHGMSRSMIDWASMAFKLDRFEESVKIVIVGKYTGLQDSYLSVIKSLKVSNMSVLVCMCVSM